MDNYQKVLQRLRTKLDEAERIQTELALARQLFEQRRADLEQQYNVAMAGAQAALAILEDE